MIFPGHVAAPTLASRYLDIDRRLAIVAGLAPDLVDKFAFYVLHATHWTRIPAHSLFGLIASSLAVAFVGRFGRRSWRWGASWLAGYGLHFVCDLMPNEGALPWLWPFNRYSGYVSHELPWFLGGGPVPWLTLTAEVALVAITLTLELAHRRGRAPATGGSLQTP